MNGAASEKLTCREWRQAYAAAAARLGALPAGSAFPKHPVADQLGARASAQPEKDLAKAEFYAFSRVTINEGAGIMLKGEGRDTRFAFKMFGNTPITPDIAQTLHLQKFVVGTLFFTLAMGMFSHGTPHYHQLFQEASSRAKAYNPLLSTAAVTRGDLPDEILEFGLLTGQLIQEHEVTQAMPAEGRIAVVHDLSRILIGRAAVNVSNTTVRPRLRTFTGAVDIRMVGGQYQLVGADKRPLSPGHGLRPENGPILKCPAEDHLERFVAAGVNLLADAGYYHPGVPLEMFTAPELGEAAAQGPAHGTGEH